jgi:VanZ family protein
MQNKTIKIIKDFLWVGITLIVVLLIFHNSMYPLKQSDLQSGFVLSFLNHLFSKTGHNIVFTQFMVRKMAHFTEYFLFSILLTVTLWAIRNSLDGTFFFELFLFLAIPVLDENIQIFYPGRTSNVRDVLIDFAGCVVGIGLCRLILRAFPSGKRNPKHLNRL